MGYGDKALMGKSKFLREYEREEAKERGIFEKQLAAAERARKIDSERRGWASLILGPVGDFLVDELGTVDGKDVESYGIDVDVGKFNVGASSDYKEAQRLLDEHDIGMDDKRLDMLGTSLLSIFAGGGNLLDAIWKGPAFSLIEEGWDWLN